MPFRDRLDWLHFAGPAAAVLLLGLDLSMELGVAAGVPYVVLVLMTLSRGQRTHTVLATSTAVLLILVGWGLSPPGGEGWKIATNRLLAIFAVLSTALAVMLKHAADERLKKAEEARRALAREFAEQEALARLGAMAAMVAHEVKNPMAGVLGALGVLGGRLPEDAAEHDILERIRDRIEALVSWIDELLSYAKPPAPHLIALDFRLVVDASVRLFKANETMDEVEVVIEMDEEPVLVAGDPDLLRRAMLNLLSNAGEAMHGDGSIRVRVSRAGEWCDVEVADHGPGIPEELRKKVLRPFFTTRGQGTGLGMPVVLRTIKSHGGELLIDCAEGWATVIRIRLPIAPEPPADRAE